MQGQILDVEKGPEQCGYKWEYSQDTEGPLNLHTSLTFRHIHFVIIIFTFLLEKESIRQTMK